MKKLLVGCLFFFLIAGIAGAIGTYFFVIKPVRTIIAEVSHFTEWEGRVSNNETFQEPENGQLTSAQVERFVAVQRAIDAHLEPHFDDISRVAEEGKDLVDMSDVTQIIQSLKEVRRLISIAADARDVQVNALNQHRFSVAEYRWMQQQILAAAYPGVDANLLEQIASAGGSIDPATFGAPTGSAPDEAEGETAPSETAPTLAAADDPTLRHNLQLMEPYTEELARWARYWFISF